MNQFEAQKLIDQLFAELPAGSDLTPTPEMFLQMVAMAAYDRGLKAGAVRNAPIPLPSAEIVVGYMNHRHEFGRRTIRPMHLWYGSTQWHTTPQYFIKAWDVEKKSERDFALLDMYFTYKQQPNCVLEVQHHPV